MKLSDMESSVLRLLKMGKLKAITGKALAQILGERNDRRIRQIILSLIEKGYPIASSNKEPLGFYIAETYKEMVSYRLQLLSRIRGDAHRLKYFNLACQKNVTPRQGMLNLARL